MQLIVPALLLLSAPVATSKTPQAETFAATGETHLRRATDEHSLPEFHAAHKNFDSAYLIADDARYLCRALVATELALLTVSFANDQERLSWEELRREDLTQLQEDAEVTKRSNCRFDASGKPMGPRVAMLTDADAPAPDASSPSAPEDAEATTIVASTSAATPSPPMVVPTTGPGERQMAGPSPAQARRGRAHTIAGAIFTTAGFGLLGGAVAVARLEAQRVAEMDGLVRTAMAEGRKFTAAEDRRFGELKGDVLRGVRVGVGVGVAGFATLVTGIAVLATRKRAMRRTYAIEPYGTLQGAGAILRWTF